MYRQLCALLTLRIKWIAHMNSRKAGEVSIGGPQLVNPMFDDEGGDVCIVCKIAGGLACLEKPLHEPGVPRSFLKQRQRR